MSVVSFVRDRFVSFRIVRSRSYCIVRSYRIVSPSLPLPLPLPSLFPFLPPSPAPSIALSLHHFPPSSSPQPPAHRTNALTVVSIRQGTRPSLVLSPVARSLAGEGSLLSPRTSTQRARRSARGYRRLPARAHGNANHRTRILARPRRQPPARTAATYPQPVSQRSPQRRSLRSLRLPFPPARDALPISSVNTTATHPNVKRIQYRLYSRR